MGLVTHSTGKRKRRNRAFTLIELLVVIAIIGILMGLIAGMAVFAKRKATEARTRTEMNYIAELIEKYRVDHGAYPADITRFEDDLPEGADLEDPWGNDYVYEREKPLVYELHSRGYDGSKANRPEDDLYPERQ